MGTDHSSGRGEGLLNEHDRRRVLQQLVGGSLLLVSGCGAGPDEPQGAEERVTGSADQRRGEARETQDAQDAQVDAVVNALRDAGSTAPPDATLQPRWARGGTATIPAQLEPQLLPERAVCQLVADTTEGPCSTESPPDRIDISEGSRGLPMVLLLQLVDARCAPLVNATVRVWHTDAAGSYSGQTPRVECHRDPADRRSDSFRGAQRADEQGMVRFHSCFPGWYPGRAIHLHFQVLTGGQSTKTSQLFFPEALTGELFATHPDYQPAGQPDRSLAEDQITRSLRGDELAQLTLNTARLEQGVLLATKRLTVTG